MLRFSYLVLLAVMAVGAAPSTGRAGSIDSVTVGTEAKLGTTYLKVEGGYTTSAANIIIQVDIKCTTKPALDEAQLAAELLAGSKYKRLSNKAVEAQTYEVTVTLLEGGTPVSTKKKTVTVTQPDANTWLVTEVVTIGME